MVTYSGQDECGNFISTTCDVQVTGAGEATIACPVTSLTCNTALGFVPGPADFFGACGNNGSITGSVSIPYTGCGDGALVVEYNGTDNCGNIISQTCTVNVTGAGPAIINCPIVNISCDEAPSFTPELATFTGECNNGGSIAGIISAPFNGCSSGTIGVTYSCLLYTSPSPRD